MKAMSHGLTLFSAIFLLLLLPGSNGWMGAGRRVHLNVAGRLAAKDLVVASTTSLFSESLSDAWEAYNAALEAHPLIVKSVTASVILGAADLTGQAFEQQRGTKPSDNRIDLARTIRFATFGLVLQAPWNHYYYLLLDGAIPPTPDPFTPTNGLKIVIDQFIQAPLFTVLIFVFLGVLEGRTLQEVQKQLQKDYPETIVNNWKLWVPATIINIGFVPPILRVLYLNFVFFFWSIYLSLVINKKEEG